MRSQSRAALLCALLAAAAGAGNCCPFLAAAGGGGARKLQGYDGDAAAVAAHRELRDVGSLPGRPEGDDEDDEDEEDEEDDRAPPGRPGEDEAGRRLAAQKKTKPAKKTKPKKKPASKPAPTPTPTPAAPAAAPGAGCSLAAGGTTTAYATCYKLNAAGGKMPDAIYLSPTAKTMRVALRSAPGGADRWLGFSIAGPFSLMAGADAVLAWPCAAGKMCAGAFDLGNSYRPAGFSPSPRGLKLVGSPVAAVDAAGVATLQFEMEWGAAWGASVETSYAAGPTRAAGVLGTREHEVRRTPAMELARDGTVRCTKDCLLGA